MISEKNILNSDKPIPVAVFIKRVLHPGVLYSNSFLQFNANEPHNLLAQCEKSKHELLQNLWQELKNVNKL